MLGRWLSAFRRNKKGNVAMLWALMGGALVGLVGLTVDFTRAESIRTQLQNAADGAALAAARAPGNITMAARTDAARAYFESEAGDLAPGTTFSLTPVGANGYRVNLHTSMEGGLTHLISNQNWGIDVQSDAERGGMNLEVALVLDTTGSMGQQNRIQDLVASAGDLVDIIVQPVQTPYYSKMALVTYANGVNVGSYAAAVRGAVTPARALSFTANTVTGIAKAGTCTASTCILTVTSTAHGFQNGDRVYFTGVLGMTNVNNQTNYYVANSAANTFRLATNAAGTTLVNGSTFTNFASSPNARIRRCGGTAPACEVVFNATGHGFAAGDYVYVTGVGGMAASNGGQAINNPNPVDDTNPTLWRVGSVPNADMFSLQGSTVANYAAYTSGGTAYCLVSGCQYLRFTNPSNDVRVFQISTCVTERIGAEATTDAAPGGALVGRQYPVSSNPCDTGTGIIPLTTDTASLHTRINGLVASGSTSGHVGAAWGWYMVSPNFGSLWPAAANRPAAYGAPETMKIVVLMTDGAFNSPYCNGVIASNAISGSGSSDDHINCNATNGSSANQTIAMCNAMKARGVVVYTIGFRIDNDATAENVMETCASSPANYKSASDGAALRDAFRQIGQAISQLRLTH